MLRVAQKNFAASKGPSAVSGRLTHFDDSVVFATAL